MGRKKIARDETFQTGLRLPEAMYEALKTRGGSRGLADEIRGRLQASLTAEEQDPSPATQKLLALIPHIRPSSFAENHAWNENAWSFEVMRSAVLEFFEAHRPAGEPKVPEEAQVLWGNDSPERVGKMVMSFLMRGDNERQAGK